MSPALATAPPDLDAQLVELAQSCYGRIYVATNRVNGKSYVGQTIASVRHRWAVHKSEAKNGRGRSRFYKAIRRYGADVFDVQEVAIGSGREELNNLERAWVILLGTLRDGYNLSSGGDSGGRLHPDTKAKIGDANRGRQVSAETRKRLSEAAKGKRQSAEHVARRAASLKGRTPSEACRNAVAKANRCRVVTDDARARLSAAAKRANEVRWGRR